MKRFNPPFVLFVTAAVALWLSGPVGTQTGATIREDHLQIEDLAALLGTFKAPNAP
jgi:hypothetical protein